MNALKDAAELSTAIGEHEINDEEADRLRAAIADGITLDEALAGVLADRQARDEPPAAREELGELGDEPSPKQYRALEREAERHTAEVRGIMGPFAEGMVECERCNGIGLHEPAPQPKEHEFFKACPTCNGYGEVITGSLRGGQESRDCPACKGRGYLEKIAADGTPLAEQPTGEQNPPAAPPPPPLENGDGAHAQPAAEPTWGTPAWMGDPTLGR